MGQYFIPVLIDHHDRPVIALQPGDYGAGDKINGHSRADEPLMRAVETLLLLDGGGRLVWAGDYDGDDDGTLALYWSVEPRHLVRLPGLTERPDNTADHFLTRGYTPAETLPHPTARWILNPERREYIDKLHMMTDHHGIRRSPLPTLTAEGGPARGPARGRARSWARQRIHLTNQRPPAGWTSVSHINHL